MRKLLPLVLLVMAGLTCSKSTSTGALSFQNTAVISGINLCASPCVLECPCFCQKIYFQFTDSTYTNNIPVDNPEILNLPQSVTFPVHLKLNWVNTTRCGQFAIRITSFEII